MGSRVSLGGGENRRSTLYIDGNEQMEEKIVEIHIQSTEINGDAITLQGKDMAAVGLIGVRVPDIQINTTREKLTHLLGGDWSSHIVNPIEGILGKPKGTMRSPLLTDGQISELTGTVIAFKVIQEISQVIESIRVLSLNGKKYKEEQEENF